MSNGSFASQCRCLFFSISFYTIYKEQSKTSRQQASKHRRISLSSASRVLFLHRDNLTLLAMISLRATDCVWPRTRKLACSFLLLLLLFLISLSCNWIQRRIQITRSLYVDINIIEWRQREERCRLYPNSTCRQTCLFVGTNNSLVLHRQMIEAMSQLQSDEEK